MSASPETDLVLSPELAGTLMSFEEFDAAQREEGYVYELVHGILIVSPAPSEGERGPNDRLGFLLQAYREFHPGGQTLDLTLPEQTIPTSAGRRRADRALWIGLGRTPRVRRDPPTIAVEFVSAARRDRRRDFIEKRDEYLAAGVEEYWVVDRFRRRMCVFRRGEPEIVVGENEVYRTPLLPGFELPLKQLFAVSDALEQSEQGSEEGSTEL